MSRQLYCLCSTREKYPTFRVDLTELFSRELVSKGFSIDWHMQAFEQSDSHIIILNDNERVYVGATKESDSLYTKIINHFYSLRHDLKLYKLVKNNAYDFVQVRDKPFAALIGMLAARRENIPFYYWMSFPYPEADLFKSIDKDIYIPLYLRMFYRARGLFTDWLLYKVVLPRSNHIFVQSDQMEKDVINKGVKSDFITPVPMGISLYQLDNIELPEITEDKISGRIPLIYVGTLVRVRRMDFLIEMIKLVRERIPKAILLLVGDASDSDMNFLKESSERLGVKDHVVFTGFVPMDKAWAYIKVSEVCLSPFRPSPILNSTTPTKVVEYLALGKPVVANTHPDQSKVLNESKAGYAVDYTPAAFADAVVKIIQNPDIARDMGIKGKEYVINERSYDVLSNQLVSKYLELLNLYGQQISVRGI